MVPANLAKDGNKLQYLWVIKWKALNANELEEERKKGSKRFRKIKARKSWTSCSNS